MKKFPVEIPEGSIVGLNYSGMHDTSVAVISPAGEPLYAISLERLTRIKQDGRSPKRLLEGIPWDKVSKVAISVSQSYDPPMDLQNRYHPIELGVTHHYDRSHGAQFYENLNFIPVDKVFVPHHIAHAASAFWGSDFIDATCLVYDGGMSNEEWFGGVFDAKIDKGVATDELFSASCYTNITRIYSAVTALLGFQPLKHEGKITGLAANGRPTNKCRNLLERWLNEPSSLDGLLVWENMYEELHAPKLSINPGVAEALKREISSFSDTELAATVQEITEEHVTTILDRVKQEKQSKNLCLSGGLFANVKVNQRASEVGFNKTFISPAMSDDGTALGAAFHVSALNKCPLNPKPRQDVYLGPSYSTNALNSAIRNSGTKTEVSKNIPFEIAELLHDGAIVAVFNGCMEFGPRALGNRSILANANDHDINRKLNRLLHRTDFMPFAPICCEEDAELLFNGIDKVRQAARFMTTTLDCTERMARLHPAVVHVDGTARPQLISSETNKLAYEILTNYKKLSGKFALVNTSFNIHEEPIIMSPKDALKGFYESGIDVLLLGNKLIKSSANSSVALNYVRSKMNVALSSTKQLKQEVYAETVRVLQATERADEAIAIAKKAETRADEAAVKVTAAEVSAAQADERLEIIRSQLFESEQALRSKDSAIEQLKQEVYAETARVLQATERADEAIAIAKKAETRADEAAVKVTAAEVSAAQADERLEIIRSQLFESEQALRSKDSTIEQLHHRNQLLEHTYVELSQELDAIYHSKSWRITWPLRKIMQLIIWLLSCLGRLSSAFKKVAFWLLNGSLAWLTLRPGSRPRRTAKRIFLKLRDWILRSPHIKSRILLILQQFPLLKNRLKQFHNANPPKTVTQINAENRYLIDIFHDDYYELMQLVDSKPMGPVSCSIPKQVDYDIFIECGPIFLERYFTGVPLVNAMFVRHAINTYGEEQLNFFHGDNLIRFEIIKEIVENSSNSVLEKYTTHGQIFSGSLTDKLKICKKSLGIFTNSRHGLKRLFTFEAQIFHDLTTIITPEFHNQDTIDFHTNNLNDEINLSDVLIAVSHSTSNDLQIYCGVPENKIIVSNPGVVMPNKSFLEAAFEIKNRRLMSGEKKIISIFGTLEPRKNHDLIFQMLNEFPEMLEEYMFVFVGRDGWLYSFDDLINSCEKINSVQKNAIIKLGFIDDLDKSILLGLSFGTIYASIYEGYGLPVTESLAYGCPVVASFSSSIPEAGGTNCFYFDPTDTQSLHSAILKLSETMNSDDVNAYFEEVKNFSKRRSWENFTNIIFSQCDALMQET